MSHLSEWLSSINQWASAGEDVEKRGPIALLVGMQTGAATVESSMGIPKKLNMDLPFDLAVLVLGIYPKESKTVIWKNKHPCFHCSVIYNHQDTETAGVHHCISG